MRELLRFAHVLTGDPHRPAALGLGARPGIPATHPSQGRGRCDGPGGRGRRRGPGRPRARHRDGGASFTPLPVPGSAQAARQQGPAASRATDVRFGSGADGWLFGGGLWSTHDGGHHWSAVDLPGDVHRFEAAAGTAWALVRTGREGQQQLWRSPVGVDGWEPVPDVRVDGPADLSVEGSRVVVLGAQQSPARSNAAGGFVQIENPCTGSLQTRLTGYGDLWATCVTGMSAHLATSTDDGASWTTVNVVTGQGSLPNSVVVGARSNGTAALVVPGEPLALLSADGSLTAVRQPPSDNFAVGYVGFSSGDVGYAVMPTACGAPTTMPTPGGGARSADRSALGGRDL